MQEPVCERYPNAVCSNRNLNAHYTNHVALLWGKIYNAEVYYEDISDVLIRTGNIKKKRGMILIVFFLTNPVMLRHLSFSKIWKF